MKHRFIACLLDTFLSAMGACPGANQGFAFRGEFVTVKCCCLSLLSFAAKPLNCRLLSLKPLKCLIVSCICGKNKLDLYVSCETSERVGSIGASQHAPPSGQFSPVASSQPILVPGLCCILVVKMRRNNRRMSNVIVERDTQLLVV